MPRLFAFILLVVAVPLSFGADPASVEKQIAIQKAMATARQYLQVNMPSEAVALLEAELASADGNKAFLTLLKEAYLNELSVLLKDPNANASRLAQVRRCLNLLIGDAVPIRTVVGVTDPGNKTTGVSDFGNKTTGVSDPGYSGLVTSQENSNSESKQVAAIAAFKKGEYAEAEQLFSSIGVAKLSQEHKTAWAYCRIRLAAEKVNAPQCDSATAAAIEKDVSEAMKLVPGHVELLKLGQQVVTTANLKINGREGGLSQSGLVVEGMAKASGSNAGELVETPSFRVRYFGNKELAESVARSAETLRKEIFERWSGPPGGYWQPKCEIVVHPTAETYARATTRPASSTGTAVVRLTNGRAEERTIELRADDTGIVSNALPRELTHLVLADLFPDKSPPKWAEEGMAVLAGTSEEAGRYTQTLRRCAREGEWFAVAQLMELKDYPTEKITGFYCESVSLTDYLVRMRGERYFTIFLRDCQRYGTAQSLKRQYGIDSLQALEAAWKRSALDLSRGQAP